MSEHDPLEEALAAFRKLLPPASVREGNLAAARAALTPLPAMPWWRRSITLPLPVALTTAAALLISLAVHLLPVGRKPGPPQAVLPATMHGDGSQPQLVAAADLHVEYFETQRYVSGIGVIDQDVLYRFPESTK